MSSFPSLPQWLVAGRKNVPVTLRAFGIDASDLAIDFDGARRPALISDILALCASTSTGGIVDRELLLDLPVGLRICALTTLASVTDPAPFSWHLRCAACGQFSEFTLTVSQIDALAQEDASMQTATIDLDGVATQVRRANGRDQVDWLAQAEDRLGEAIARTVVVHPTLDALLASGTTIEQIASAVDDAMASFDPLPALHVVVACPECGTTTGVFPDLAEAALQRLARAQRMGIAEVHRLASRYHWSEREILELPRWRRESYLQLIDEEG